MVMIEKLSIHFTILPAMRTVQNHHSIKELLAGEPGLMHRMYTELLPHVASYVKKNQGTRSDADEVFQEALCQIMNRAHTKGVQLRNGLNAYVFSTCRNLWRQEINRRSKMAVSITYLESKPDTYWPEEMKREEAQWSLFEEKMESLATRSKALLKDYFNGLSVHEIIEKYNYASQNTVSQRVFKCKKRLTTLIQSDSRFANCAVV